MKLDAARVFQGAGRLRDHGLEAQNVREGRVVMLLRALSIGGCFVVLAGCAAAPRAPLPAQLPWQDQAFDYDAALVSVGKRDLFQLEDALLTKLNDSSIQNSSAQYRLHYLVSILFGPKAKDFPYSGGHSTVAAETWRRKTGDCLSLTVLSYSLASALGMSVQMQEVRVPVVFDRRGNVEFLNRHVNVLIRGAGEVYLIAGSMRSGDMIIDFEPQVASRREGMALSDDGILARFYNNVAAEYLAQGDLVLAYAHFKAAVLADPGYSPSYSNLAQLYIRKGFLQSAERLLLHAIALDDDADIALRSLHQLLVSQGRESEAVKYTEILQARQEKDPYYWLGVGLDQLQRGNYRKAISALEHAQELTRGFQEVHRYLAIAYWRAGKPSQAKNQLSMLASLMFDDLGLAALSRENRQTP
ncbi:MAG TPA: tetratricopeptide repeat protein [Burkholderiales bacterium]|nr:tetratricopeptide repeat protein [Burkholderiales bacterium]